MELNERYSDLRGMKIQTQWYQSFNVVSASHKVVKKNSQELLIARLKYHQFPAQCCSDRERWERTPPGYFYIAAAFHKSVWNWSRSRLYSPSSLLSHLARSWVIWSLAQLHFLPNSHSPQISQQRIFCCPLSDLHSIHRQSVQMTHLQHLAQWCSFTSSHFQR